jgi:hypothetical protein
MAAKTLSGILVGPGWKKKFRPGKRDIMKTHVDVANRTVIALKTGYIYLNLRPITSGEWVVDLASSAFLCFPIAASPA